VVHAGAEFWDEFFRRKLDSGDDLDWAGEWTRPFLDPLREAGVRTVLELGCGTGNDAARLAAVGYSVTAVDLSGEAIARARARFGPLATFLVADITRPLPFPDGAFDAVMSNVAVHMFPDDVTRAVFRAGEAAGAGGRAVRVLLSGWQQVQLVPVLIPHRKTGEPFKHVWRGTARR
jgi:SAM-dependent methyltransferase